MLDVILKSLDTPDETGVFELMKLVSLKRANWKLCELAEWCLAGRVMNLAGDGLNM